nr:hypothetical protein [Actinomadura pelletieri]
MALEAKALRFQRDQAAVGKVGQEGLGVAVASPPDHFAGLFVQGLVVAVIPIDEAIDHVKQALAFGRPVGLVQAERRATHELDEQNGVAGGERTACPSQIQGRRVA